MIFIHQKMAYKVEHRTSFQVLSPFLFNSLLYVRLHLFKCISFHALNSCNTGYSDNEKGFTNKKKKMTTELYMH